jgi:hypothetical protein
MAEDPVPLTAEVILRMQQQSAGYLKMAEQNIWLDPDTTPPPEVVQTLATSTHPLAQPLLQSMQSAPQVQGRQAAPRRQGTWGPGVPDDPK